MRIDIRPVYKHSIDELVYHAYVDKQGKRQKIGVFTTRQAALDAGMKQRELNQNRYAM